MTTTQTISAHRLSTMPSASPSPSRRQRFSIYEDPTVAEGNPSIQPEYGSYHGYGNESTEEDSIEDGYTMDEQSSETELADDYDIDDGTKDEDVNMHYVHSEDDDIDGNDVFTSADIPLESIEVSPPSRACRKASSLFSSISPSSPQVSPHKFSAASPTAHKQRQKQKSRSQSRRISALSAATSTISSLPSSIPTDVPPYEISGYHYQQYQQQQQQYQQQQRYHHSPHTPRKHNQIQNHAFRSPSSVRALQMSSPPMSPFISPRGGSGSASASAQKRHLVREGSKTGTPTREYRRSGSMLSVQSHSNRSIDSPQPHPHLGIQQQQQQHRQGSQQPDMKQHHPLVLLHITLLPPTPPPYPPHILAAALPPHILHNIDLLRTKATDTVISRGILVPHPREDYELLEERLLESLELVEARVLRCGHFFYSMGAEKEDGEGEDGDGENERLVDEDSGSVVDDGDDGDGSASMAGSESTLKNDSSTPMSTPRRAATANDTSPSTPSSSCAHECDPSDSTGTHDVLCRDCHSPLKLSSRGAGRGPRRFDVRFYAANGLMREGAWQAAWSEMERVDVEVSAWIPERLRREMERMVEVEEEEREREREAEEMEREREREEAARVEMEMEREREKIEAEAGRARRVRTDEGFPRQKSHVVQQPGQHISSSRSSSKTRGDGVPVSNGQIPLSTLLKNYFYLLIVSRRNIAIAALSVLVLVLSAQLVSNNGSGRVDFVQPVVNPSMLASSSVAPLVDVVQNAMPFNVDEVHRLTPLQSRDEGHDEVMVAAEKSAEPLDGLARRAGSQVPLPQKNDPVPPVSEKQQAPPPPPPPPPPQSSKVAKALLEHQSAALVPEVGMQDVSPRVKVTV